MIRTLQILLCASVAFFAWGCKPQVKEIEKADETPKMTKEQKKKLMKGDAKHSKKAAEERNRSKTKNSNED